MRPSGLCCCVDCLKLWKRSFDGTSVFEWTKLYICPQSSTVESLNDFVLRRFECWSCIPINTDELFDEFCTVETYVEVKLAKWRQKDVPCEDHWLDMFSHIKQVHIRTKNIQRLVECAHCLPGASAPVGRVSSQMKKL
jgi:hypothetical protein